LLGGDVAYIFGELPQRVGSHGLLPGGIYAQASEEARAARSQHPCPRHLDHCDWLVKHYAGDIVIDPFMGSGTTMVAAQKHGRHFLGCDVVPQYVELSRRRLKAAREGLTLSEALGGQKGLWP